MKILAAMVMVVCLATAGHAVEVTVGDTQVSLPDIAGYSRVSQDVRQFGILESLTPETNRLICVYARPDDADRINAGAVLDLTDYILVQSFRNTEFTRISPEEMKANAGQIVDSVNSTVEAMDVDALMAETSDRLLKQHNLEAVLDMERPILLQKAEVDGQSVAFTLLSKVSVQSGPEVTSHTMLARCLILSVRGKVMYIYVYRRYTSIEDVGWAVSLGDRVREELLQVNQVGSP